MDTGKSQHIKTSLHPRNRNREPYDLDALVKVNPELAKFIKPNKYGANSVDFADPAAVKMLNKSLLKHYYGINYWEFPDKNLCPPIPGRADYIHHMADLLSESNFGVIPTGQKISCFDVGTGASCIYPIIGVTEYGWNFIGSDIDRESIRSANRIVNSNTSLKNRIECRWQKNLKNIFSGVTGSRDIFDVSVCNPPFHASLEDAQQGTRRKVKNLSGRNTKKPTLNFAGVSNELIYEGGEYKFIDNMVWESKKRAKNCFWFSTLVSKQSNVKGIYKLLEKAKARHIKTIPMGTGNKITRIVAWTFLTKEEQIEWAKARWGSI